MVDENVASAQIAAVPSHSTQPPVLRRVRVLAPADFLTCVSNGQRNSVQVKAEYFGRMAEHRPRLSKCLDVLSGQSFPVRTCIVAGRNG